MAAALSLFLASISALDGDFSDFYMDPEELDDPELAEAFSLLCGTFLSSASSASNSTPESSDHGTLPSPF